MTKSPTSDKPASPKLRYTAEELVADLRMSGTGKRKMQALEAMLATFPGRGPKPRAERLIALMEGKGDDPHPAAKLIPSGTIAKAKALLRDDG